jgi:hypothetical protein
MGGEREREKKKKNGEGRERGGVWRGRWTEGGTGGRRREGRGRCLD